ncbi:hypothetical protein HETIRDRAFT_418191 [Heterobasidion irregulare TC 32-1]|uniref:Uncharacterized protein n=1 Tax=Heterobasidion irregulare (strain TC 32-1) TaxID=747525 RepID=W4K942_HETIT|nr:uncharacterized protein HETIRDRAFT_418191 [Heterobasidion irregulare TC 32-1]ETW82347.1 hypothetical protein HETIRDRAFT_418191 [Heterobasidion irregulare TC 32-1]
MATACTETHESYHVSLEELCARAGVAQFGDIESAWDYVEGRDLLDLDVAASCSAQLDFIAKFKLHWASALPHSLGIPEEWKQIGRPTAWNLQTWMHSAALMSWLQPIDEHTTTLSEAQLATNHDDLSSFAPDFSLRAPQSSVPRSEDDQPFSKNSLYTLPFFFEIVTYPGDEDNATFSIPSFFLSTPGCVLVPKLQLDFPPPLQGASECPSETFGLLMDSYNPFPSSIDLMKATLLEPALLVGMKGPSPWPSHISSHPVSSTIPPTSMDLKVRDLSQVIQPSLDTHLLNWCLRCEQNVQAKVPLPFVSSSSLPPCFMIFGILYDADGLVIVAHIPYPAASPAMATTSDCTLSYAYLSCIVDRIPMTGADRPSSLDASTESLILANFRAALALSSLQRHAFMMLTLWERVEWPTAIVDVFAALSGSGKSEDGSGSQYYDYSEDNDSCTDDRIDEEEEDDRSRKSADIDHDHDHDHDYDDDGDGDPIENKSKSNKGGARDDYVGDEDGSRENEDGGGIQDYGYSEDHGNITDGRNEEEEDGRSHKSVDIDHDHDVTIGLYHEYI